MHLGLDFFHLTSDLSTLGVWPELVPHGVERRHFQRTFCVQPFGGGGRLHGGKFLSLL